MESLSFYDGFLSLFLLQSFLIGIVLAFDGVPKNKFLGVFVMVYTLNSARVILFRMTIDNVALQFYRELSFAGFLFPLLYFFLKAHLAPIRKKELLIHSLSPIVYLVFSAWKASFRYLWTERFSDWIGIISYSGLLVLAIAYGILSYQLIYKNQYWNAVLKKVRNRTTLFVFGLYAYFILLCFKVLIESIWFPESYSNSPLNQIQNIVFYLVFFLIPIYAFSVLNRLKKFIQPKHVVPEKIDQIELNFKKQVTALFEQQKLHTQADLNINTLATMLNMASKDLRIHFQNHFQTSVPEYLTLKRLEEFKDLVLKDQSGVYNIEGLALNAGFRSRPTFYRAFKKKYGITPGEYINQIEASHN